MVLHYLCILYIQREEQIRKEMERHDRERRKEEERILREKQREEERYQREQRRELERRERFLQKESIRVSSETPFPCFLFITLHVWMMLSHPHVCFHVRMHKILSLHFG